ncbi:hypothetical protein P8452_48123 [Trifolium repens]|nr:hypothetical protein P8452_48123 [Trifolium repens]
MVPYRLLPLWLMSYFFSVDFTSLLNPSISLDVAFTITTSKLMPSTINWRCLLCEIPVLRFFATDLSLEVE